MKTTRPRRRLGDEAGSIAAEQVAVVLLVAAITAGLSATLLPERVEGAARDAVECTFTRHCDLADGADLPDDGQDPDEPAPPGAVGPVPFRPGDQPADDPGDDPDVADPSPTPDVEIVVGQLRTAIEDGDADAIATVLADHADDPDVVRTLVDELGPDGLSELLYVVVQEGDVETLTVLATGLFGGALDDDAVDELLSGLQPDEVLLLAAAADAPVSDRLLRAVLDPYHDLHLDPAAQSMVIGYLLEEGYLDPDAEIPDVEGALQLKVLTELLADPDGWQAIEEHLANGNPVFHHLTDDSAVLVGDFLVANPSALDDLVDGADDMVVDDAVGIPTLINVLEGTGQVDAIVERYVAYVVDDAVVPGNEAATSANLTDAGEAIGRLQIAAEEADLDMGYDVTGFAIDAVVFGLGEIPLVGTPVAGGEVVLGNMVFPAPADFRDGVVANQQDFTFAVDVLTSGHPDRDVILADLGFEVGEDGRLAAPDDLDLRELATAEPHYVPLIEMADNLADGMAIPQGQVERGS